MDNNELDQFLHKKFAQVRGPLDAPSMVDEVMQRIDHLPAQSGQRRWILGLAILLGALVCLPSVEVLQLQLQNLAGWLNTQLFALTAAAGPAQALLNGAGDPAFLAVLLLLLLLPPVFVVLEE